MLHITVLEKGIYISHGNNLYLKINIYIWKHMIIWCPLQSTEDKDSRYHLTAWVTKVTVNLVSQYSMLNGWSSAHFTINALAKSGGIMTVVNQWLNDSIQTYQGHFKKKRHLIRMQCFHIGKIKINMILYSVFNARFYDNVDTIW